MTFTYTHIWEPRHVKTFISEQVLMKDVRRCLKKQHLNTAQRLEMTAYLLRGLYQTNQQRGNACESFPSEAT